MIPSSPWALLRAAGLSLALVGSPESALGLRAEPETQRFVDIVPRPISRVSGEVEILGFDAGIPADGVLLDGSVDPSDVSIRFRTTLDPDADGLAGLYVLLRGRAGSGPVAPVAAGFVPGPDADATQALLSPVTDIARMRFAGELLPGRASDVFFVSYDAVAKGMAISIAALAATETPPPFRPVFFVTPGARIVPEPAGVARAGLAALVVFCARGRSARRGAARVRTRWRRRR